MDELGAAAGFSAYILEAGVALPKKVAGHLVRCGIAAEHSCQLSATEEVLPSLTRSVGSMCISCLGKPREDDSWCSVSCMGRRRPPLPTCPCRGGPLHLKVTLLAHPAQRPPQRHVKPPLELAVRRRLLRRVARP